MTIEGNKITADEGFLLQRISDGEVFGKTLALGVTYYMYGKRMEKGFLEKPEHYTEIPEPMIELPEDLTE